ncbi:MAG: Lrp/AsnC family transcriptional regulator [Oscillospiraceae bacterium]|nr:Lrp/AsnC family transcriptional regulator [Oscillospiraceae bacterium]
MDATDRSILKSLAHNARTPVKQLAQEAFLSSPAASSRVERLEKKGVIKGYQAMLDYEALGFHIMAFVNVAIAPERQPAFVEYVSGCPNVLECHHITGLYSLILKVAFCTTRDLEAFVGYLQKYGKTETQVVFSTLVEPRQIVE